MPVETYTYDEPVGKFSYESHERLAAGVISASIRYEDAITAAGLMDEPHYSELLGSEVTTVPSEEVHLGTLVESRDAYFGHALAVSLGETAMIGVYCRVRRDGEPTIDELKALNIARTKTYSSNQDYKDEVDKLTRGFDKTQLEAIMRILGKVTVSLEIAHELGSLDQKDFKRLSAVAQRKKEAEVKDDVMVLKRLSAVEPYTLYALQINPELSARTSQPKHNEIIHISEWTEFTDAATDLIDREADPGQVVSHVNLQHEIDNEMYYIKLIARHGQLAGAQVLCEVQTDAWKCQYFKIDSDEDEDGAGLNMVNQMWNRTDVISSLREGGVIDNEIYEGYRSMAEDSLEKVFTESMKLVRPQDIIKRPAA